MVISPMTCARALALPSPHPTTHDSNQFIPMPCQLPARPIRACHSANVIGPAMIRLRHERGWNQSDLVTHLQLRGCEITRAIVANIETGRSRATDVLVFEIAMVFEVSPASLFPAPRPGQPQAQLGITPFTARRRRRLAHQAGGIMEDTLLVLKGQAQVASG